MRKLGSYFGLQLKRSALLIPRMLAVTLLLALLTAMAALALSRMGGEDNSKTLIRIGLVGDTGEKALSDAIELFKRMDSSRYSIRLDRMDAAEADRLLRRGEINGYLDIPDGFAEALWYSEHLPLTYYSNTGGADVGSQLTREIVDAISGLAAETENANYGCQFVVRDMLPGMDPYQAGDSLGVNYVLTVLDRAKLFRLEYVDRTDTLSLAGYYLCGMLLLFVMLWSVSCAPLFSRRSRELDRLLSAEGMGAAGQVVSEFAGYLLLLACAVLAAGGPIILLLSRFGISVPELAAREGGAWNLLPGFLPPALMLCALQFLLYELAEGAVSGVMLQFLNAAVQGYLAGCFYPASFFPEGLRRLGELLPAGFAMRYLRARLMGRTDGAAAAGVWVYFALFLGLSLLVRSRRNHS